MSDRNLIIQRLLGPSVFLATAFILVVFFMSINQEPTMDNSKLTLTSTAFEHMGKIPSIYTCDGSTSSPQAGDDTPPPLKISGVPEGAKSLVLLMDDPDIPESAKEKIGKDSWDHWVLYNIPVGVTELDPTSLLLAEVGLNSRGEKKYGGPCPPDREHRYFFKLYALSEKLSFPVAPTLLEVEEAMKDITVAKTELVGVYERLSKDK